MRHALATRVTGIVLLASLFSPWGAGRAIAEPPHHAAALSLLYPISTNQDPNLYVVVGISALYGRVGSIRTLGLNGVASLVGHDVHGLQATGVYSQVGGEVRGVQLTGAFNYVAGSLHGLQLTGVGSVIRSEVHGVQASGLFNSAESTLCGAQFTWLYNNVGSSARGLQLAGFANSAGGDLHGGQLSGGFNFVSGELSGLQAGLVNMAIAAHGAQVGLANLSREASGLQIGAWNMTGEQKGVPVGLVNKAKNGTAEWIAYGSNFSTVNLGVRTTVRKFYSMLTAGTPDLEDNVPPTLVLTWNYGYTVFSGKKLSAGLDLGFAHYIPTEVGEPGENDQLHFALQARGLLERSFGPKWSAFAGGGVGRVYSEYSLGAPSETKGLFFGGVSLR